MIVPISLVSTDGYQTLRDIIVSNNRGYYFSNFGVRPAKLFEGADKRLTIFISTSVSKNNTCYTTKYYRWITEERETLFEKILYSLTESNYLNISGFLKISDPIELQILLKLKNVNRKLSYFTVGSSSYTVNYTRKLQYFIQFFLQPPIIKDISGKIISPSELKHIYAQKPEYRDILLAILNSNLFFWFFISFSDCRNVNQREIINFPVDLEKIDNKLRHRLCTAGKFLVEDLQKKSIFINRNDRRAGQLQIQSFQPRQSKHIVDQIDEILSKYYGFTEEELDFIINYDIKYRMGSLLNAEDEDSEDA